MRHAWGLARLGSYGATACGQAKLELTGAAPPAAKVGGRWWGRAINCRRTYLRVGLEGVAHEVLQVAAGVHLHGGGRAAAGVEAKVGHAIMKDACRTFPQGSSGACEELVAAMRFERGKLPDERRRGVHCVPEKSAARYRDVIAAGEISLGRREAEAERFRLAERGGADPRAHR